MLVTILMLTLGWVAQAQTDQNPTVKTDHKGHVKKVRKPAAAVVPAAPQADKEVQADKSATTDAAMGGQSVDTAPSASSEAATPTPNPTPAPTAAINSAAVAPRPPLDKAELNITIYRESEGESLGAVARKIRAKKAVEAAAGNTQ